MLSRFWADFEPILAKKTPEFFDKIKAGEFTLNAGVWESWFRRKRGGSPYF